MPHKRNPVICERICGLSRLVRANAHAALENVALWHERDISHSSVERVILPDSTMLLDYMLHKCAGVVGGLLVYPHRMLSNVALTHGLIFSQRVLLALMEKGLKRPVAYDMVQRCAMRTWKEHRTFKDTLLDDAGVAKYLDTKELDTLLDINYYLRHAARIFRRLGL
jgi:adenylosuccinate lyase